MSHHTTEHTDRARRLRVLGLAGALLCAAVAAVLWFVAGAVAGRECLDSGYGLADSVTMTEAGCEVTVRTADGPRSAVLPTLGEPMAAAALAVGLGAAVPPALCLWLSTRRRA
jgi:hypothetical protein